MKIFKSVLFIIISIPIISISSFQKSTFRNLKNEHFFEIKFEEIINKKNTSKLSQIATDVIYIPLETNDNCVINQNAKFYFAGNFIFVNNRDHILKFTSNGKFLKKIGSPGRGPGEINSIRNLSVLPEKKLIVVHDYAPHKLLYFDFDGNYIKTVKILRYKEINVLDNGNYIAISQATGSSEKFTHLLLDKFGDTLSVINNNLFWKTSSPITVSKSSPSFEPFYKYKNHFYLKSLYNDTIYIVNDDKILPCYFINLGKYKLPSDKIWERLSPNEARILEKTSLIYCYSYVFEAGGRLFLTIDYWGENDKVDHFIINKKDFINNTVDKYSNVSKGWIDNDWDGGTLFWPKGNISDNEVFMPIFVPDLKNVINFRKSSNSLKTIVKFPEKRTQLEKMASDLDISDNPILMIVTLKSE
jgi:hypothetical protein